MIPTAVEFLQNKYKLQDPEVIKRFSKDLIEFAKLHVEAQREAIIEKSEITHDGYDFIVDKESIIKAYPLTKIK